MSLALEINRLQNLAVVTCRGRIVFGPETTDFCRSVRDLLPTHPRILLNLREVEYVDSGGLGSIVGLVLAARRAEGELAICEPSPRVGDLLRLTRLSSVVQVFSSREQAVTELGKRTVAA